MRNDPSARPRHAVVEALAEVRNAGAVDLTTVYEYIEPAALDALLLHNSGTDVSVTFSVPDATVAVWVDDERAVVEVTEKSR